MNEKYKISREIGRAKPKPPPMEKEEEIESMLDITGVPNEKIEELKVDGRFYLLNSFIGDSSNVMMIKSDIAQQINNAEELMGTTVAGLVVMVDGSVGLLMSEV